MIKENPELGTQESMETGLKYWKSLDALAETPGFNEWIQDEFPQGASFLQGFERRGFMKIMAASFGLAGLGMTGCRRPEQAIMPYGKSPEELIPGVPNYYASSMPSPHGNLPLVVESHSGRPTKIEGNPSYLSFGGSTDVYAQASVLDLYDPDRAMGSFRKDDNKEDAITWSSLDTKSSIQEVAKWGEEGKLAVLADKSFSLARSKLSLNSSPKGFNGLSTKQSIFGVPKRFSHKESDSNREDCELFPTSVKLIGFFLWIQTFLVPANLILLPTLVLSWADARFQVHQMPRK